MKQKTDWLPVLQTIRFAFHAIVNAHTGQIFGYEALLRDWDKAGFPSIQSLFDTAAQENSLVELDEWLRLKVIGTFLTAGFFPGTKLFYNVDNRLFQYPEYSTEGFAKKLEEIGFPKDSFFLEISENRKLGTSPEIRQFIAHHREHHIRIALDDFGVGYSGLQVLFDMDPDLIKVDRYFIEGIDREPKKRLFVQHLVEMAHVLGIQVIAEGIETDSEFFACREIGCDFVQGFRIHYPSFVSPIDTKSETFPSICNLLRAHKRNQHSFSDHILKEIYIVKSYQYTDSIETILKHFKENPSDTYVPIVNRNGEPLGIIREKDFKGYLYSPFGYELLKNKSLSVKSFIQPAPLVDLHSRLEKFLHAYALAEGAETLLVTNNGKYLGCLSQRSLLQLIHKKEVLEARDQNPLTRLKGNLLINEYLQESLSDLLYQGLLVYFDFDHFKPYNDTYGFRQGDRVILLFADLLREYEQQEGWFIGHIGGDDFFAAILLGGSIETHLTQIKNLQKKFTQDVIAFYHDEDQKRGYIRAKGRNGRFRRFPLLSVSSAIIGIRGNSRPKNLNEVSKVLAVLKKKAKESPERIAFTWFSEETEAGNPSNKDREGNKNKDIEDLHSVNLKKSSRTLLKISKINVDSTVCTPL